MKTNITIKRKDGEDFIIAEYGAFGDEYKTYLLLRGKKAVEYLLSIGYTSDKSNWLYTTHKEEYYTKKFMAVEQPDDVLVDGEPCFQLLDGDGVDIVGEYITRADVMSTTKGDVFFKYDN